MTPKPCIRYVYSSYSATTIVELSVPACTQIDPITFSLEDIHKNVKIKSSILFGCCTVYKNKNDHNTLHIIVWQKTIIY